MEILRHVVVFIHLVGFATLFGAWAAQAFGGKREITRLMSLGLAVAAVAGIALAAPWGTDAEFNYVKISVKLVVMLAIGAVLGIGSKKQRVAGATPTGLFWAVGILTLLNAAVAVLWR